MEGQFYLVLTCPLKTQIFKYGKRKYKRQSCHFQKSVPKNAKCFLLPNCSHCLSKISTKSTKQQMEKTVGPTIYPTQKALLTFLIKLHIRHIILEHP